MLLLFLDCAAFFGDNCRRFASGFGGEDEEQSMIHGDLMRKYLVGFGGAAVKLKLGQGCYFFFNCFYL
ncbi:hypothetical protein CICLE_v10018406mg [Citrus x clementina]|uniref:Uncharacterized protein n=1 Tax=Citrus clementina TaxID=85681 RepID=V4TGD3_CITCL|nr:hypothetical protein CICLE_v10018406mg [Citrus x clementina]